MQTPAPFEYQRASSVDEAVALLSRHGPESRLLAGGHSLLPMMKLRLARPETLIDINGLADLDYIRLDGDDLTIGAMTRHAAVLDSPLLAEHYRIFAEAERVIADPLVRNRGTVGGSLCQADPSEDLSAVFSALRGQAVVRSADGTRIVELRDFHVGPYETAVGEAEILVEVRIPIRARVGSAYEKVERRAGDWSIAAAGSFVQIDGDTISDVGIGLTAVGAEHFTCVEAEERLRGGPASEEAVAAAAGICAESCHPSADQRGPVDYKRHLVGVLVARALNRSIAAATRNRGNRLMHVTVTVNGVETNADIEARLLLVHYLRDTLGLTGTHWGCDTSNCGACTVWLDGVPVKSCTTLAAMADGHVVRTVEDLEVDGTLDPLQQGFVEEHGLQCGFCTPGMMMTTRALLDRDSDPDEATIREAISGNLCRCTGYENIVRAVRWAAAAEADARRSDQEGAAV